MVDFWFLRMLFRYHFYLSKLCNVDEFRDVIGFILEYDGAEFVTNELRKFSQDHLCENHIKVDSNRFLSALNNVI